ncbi:xylulose kinase [Lineolata rhizophorae]|uniref:Xylulose kinase n=1 Tax=Lineolata rhizophorae TaxID=578093 RepID=A0A6A6PBY0_9PEZI|nr:xylulose kinase [Lineolata rhizophorae]
MALYLGFDLSTQQLKGIAVDSSLKLQHEAKVDFDADLSKYGIQKGVLANPAAGEIFAPVAMWLEAVDLVLSRLRDAGLDFSRVRGVSGAGMQHGTVFWSAAGERMLERLRPDSPLVDQLDDAAFTSRFSPNWQDASTQAQCDAFDEHLGSSTKLAEATGSKAHHWLTPLVACPQRFSGPQIMRFREKQPDAYAKTARISLVSSFLASIFLGRIAPIDIGDVCGMNLWDVRSGKWDERLLTLAAGEPEGVAALREKLGHVPEDGGGAFGPVSSYMAGRWGFPSDGRCQVIPFTGDNPSTILALPLRASDAIVSLGTSTTFLMSTPEWKPDPAYHFMNHPTTAGLYMFMLCYKNGGLAREHIRDAINEAGTDRSSRSSSSSSSNSSSSGANGANGAKSASEKWAAFNETAVETAPLQPTADGRMRLGLFFPRPEIVPNVRQGTWRALYEAGDGTLTPAKPGTGDWPLPHTDARAILESQFLSLRLRSQRLVHPPGGAQRRLPAQPRRIYLVGGGSANPAIARLCGDVLGGAEGIFRLDIGGNACALGAAYKAVWGVERDAAGRETFEDLIEKRWFEEGFVRRVADGYKEGVWESYGEALRGFDMLEKQAIAEAGNEKALKKVVKPQYAG